MPLHMNTMASRFNFYSFPRYEFLTSTIQFHISTIELILVKKIIFDI